MCCYWRLVVVLVIPFVIVVIIVVGQCGPAMSFSGIDEIVMSVRRLINWLAVESSGDVVVVLCNYLCMLVSRVRPL